MNKILVYIYLVFYTAVFSQEDTLLVKIQRLEEAINQSKKFDKLKLLDSLNGLVLDKPDYQYDSIARITIAQAVKLDSMKMGMQHIVDLIHFYGNVSESPEKGITVYEDFKHIIPKIDDKTLLTLLHIYAGDCYTFSGKLKASIPFYTEAENFALQANDSIRYGIARSSKAFSISDLGHYVESSKLLTETANIFMSYKDTFNLTSARNSLSILYSKMGFFEEAEKERNEAIKLALLQKDYEGMQTYYQNASMDAYKTGNQDSRISNLKKSYAYGLKSEEGFRLKLVVVCELLRAYADTDSLTKAEVYYDKAKSLYANKNITSYEDYYRVALADYYYAKNEPKKALIEATKALELLLEISDVEAIYEAYERLGKIYIRLNDYKSAYLYNTKYIVLKDSINSIQKSNALSYYQTLYETEKRDFKIAEQASQIALLDAENKINRQWMLFGGAGLLLGFLIIYLIRSRKFISSKQELQEKFSQDLINEQEKERSRLARDLHDSVGQKLMLLSKTTQKLGDENVEKLATNTLEEVRSISRGLHPSNLERLGLTEAINALIYDINANTDLFFTDEIDNIDNALSKESELHLYRIIQETLNNIIKHSEAKAVKVKVDNTSKNVTVMISDNGKGFDFEVKLKNMSLGLKTLFERANIINAVLSLEGKKGAGTIMKLSVPIPS